MLNKLVNKLTKVKLSHLEQVNSLISCMLLRSWLLTQIVDALNGVGTVTKTCHYFCCKAVVVQ